MRSAELEMKEMQSYSYDEAHDGYGDSRWLNSRNVLSGYDFAALEILQTRQDQMFRDSGISTRGFTWSDDVFRTNVHAANFAGMDAASMVATGSWSSPSKDFLTIASNDRSAVTSLNILDVAPTDGVFLDGVRNGYAFVENNNFGFINDEVNHAAKADRPNGSNEAASKAGAHPSLDIESDYQNQNYSSTESARLGSEDFGATHALHDVIVAHEGGDFRG